MARERGLRRRGRLGRGPRRQHQDASRAEGKFEAGSSARRARARPAVQTDESTYHDAATRSAAARDRRRLARRSSGQRAVLVLDREPVLRRVRRPGRRHGHDRDARRRFRFEVEDTHKDGASRRPRRARCEGEPPPRGRARRAEVDARAPRPHAQEPHGDAPPAQGAARRSSARTSASRARYVGPDRLRFDFSHPKAVTPEEIERIEQLVNERDRRQRPGGDDGRGARRGQGPRRRGACSARSTTSACACVDVGGWSTELCGGTHVRAAGDIGPFVILSEARHPGRRAAHRGRHRSGGRAPRPAAAQALARGLARAQDGARRAPRAHRGPAGAAQGGQEGSALRRPGRPGLGLRDPQGARSPSGPA